MAAQFSGLTAGDLRSGHLHSGHGPGEMEHRNIFKYWFGRDDDEPWGWIIR